MSGGMGNRDSRKKRKGGVDVEITSPEKSISAAALAAAEKEGAAKDVRSITYELSVYMTINIAAGLTKMPKSGAQIVEPLRAGVSQG